MSTVYLLGAGASRGDSLRPIPEQERIAPPGMQERPAANPPVSDGFFSGELWEALRYAPDLVEADFRELFAYIRASQPHLPRIAGANAWQHLNIEDVLTSIELEREFASAESDQYGRLIVIKNKLIRFVWRILGSCTEGRYGEHGRRLASSLAIEDSVLTFNWDLLLDQEFHPLRPGRDAQASLHYDNFFGLCLKQSLLGEGGLVIVAGPNGAQGVYLKLHGSLNWFYCTNARCPAHQEITIDTNCSRVLHRAIGVHWTDETCRRCGSATSPLLIPPLLRKPIVENWIIRSTWGIARRRLAAAHQLVLIGFSAAPTDFYAAWLLRSTVGCRQDAQVFVVNPENAQDHPNYRDFKQRMEAIFPYGYDSHFTDFAQIGEIIDRLHPA